MYSHRQGPANGRTSLKVGLSSPLEETQGGEPPIHRWALERPLERQGVEARKEGLTPMLRRGGGTCATVPGMGDDVGLEKGEASGE